MSDVDTSVPAAPAAPVVETTSAPESTADQVASPEGESPEQAPERTFTQDELNKIVQKEKFKESRRAEKVAEARLRAEYAERRVQELETKLNPPTPESSGRPKFENFNGDYEAYTEAVADWKYETKFAATRKESEAQQQQRQMAERANEVLPKIKAVAEKYDDFNEVATGFTAPAALQAAMLKSAHTGELYYYLGSNPSELARISAMDDIDQVYAVRDLEAKLTAAPSPTKAAAPIVPNAGKAAVKRDTFELPWNEFVAQRRKETSRR